MFRKGEPDPGFCGKQYGTGTVSNIKSSKSQLFQISEFTQEGFSKFLQNFGNFVNFCAALRNFLTLGRTLGSISGCLLPFGERKCPGAFHFTEARQVWFSRKRNFQDPTLRETLPEHSENESFLEILPMKETSRELFLFASPARMVWIFCPEETSFREFQCRRTHAVLDPRL